MTLKGIITEIENINKELKRLRSEIRRLNKRKSHLEAISVETMKKQRKDQYEHNGQRYKVEERERRKRKTEKQKREDTMNLLRNFTSKPEELWKELDKTLRGESHTQLQLKKTKK